MNWFGVMPAVTTPFDSKLAVDHAFLAQHTRECWRTAARDW